MNVLNAEIQKRLNALNVMAVELLNAVANVLIAEVLVVMNLNVMNAKVQAKLTALNVTEMTTAKFIVVWNAEINVGGIRRLPNEKFIHDENQETENLERCGYIEKLKDSKMKKIELIKDSKNEKSVLQKGKRKD